MQRWGELEVKIVVDRYRRGYTYEEIALEVGRTSNAVYKKLRVMDFGRNYKC
jgi:predicted transcriptional regulator